MIGVSAGAVVSLFIILLYDTGYTLPHCLIVLLRVTGNLRRVSGTGRRE
jgi:hypothetical protein